MKKGAVQERVIALRFPHTLTTDDFLMLKDGIHQYNQDNDVGANKYLFESYPFVSHLPDPVIGDNVIDWSKVEVGVRQIGRFGYRDGIYIQVFSDALTFNLVERECVQGASFSSLLAFYKKFRDFFDSRESLFSRVRMLELTYLNHWDDNALRPFLSADGRSLDLKAFITSGILGKVHEPFRPVIPFRQQCTYGCGEGEYGKISLQVETHIPMSRDGKFMFDANLAAICSESLTKDNEWGAGELLPKLHEIVTKGYEQLLTEKALALF